MHSQTEQSIEGQLRECYDYANRNDCIVMGEYIDKLLTKTSDKRQKFLRMIENSKKKTFAMFSFTNLTVLPVTVMTAQITMQS